MFTSIISFIFVFFIVALAHEGGHYYFAKKAGIRVVEAGFGFGPTLFSFVKNNTKYSLNLIPILAYVNLAGIDEIDEKDKLGNIIPENEKYYNKKTFQKFLSIVAGPLCNIILAVFIVYILVIFAGMPIEKGNQIANIMPNSQAQKAGLLVGDSIISINGVKTDKVSEIINKIYNNADKDLDIKLLRNNKIIDIHATPKYDSTKKIGLLGIMLNPIVEYKKSNPIDSLWISVSEVGNMVIVIAKLLAKLFMGQIPLTSLAGPVGIAQISGQVAHQGVLQLFWFTALLSVNLGVANLIPIPALDGGRLVFIAIEYIRGKAIDIKKENQIHYIGLMILLGFMLILTIIDVRRIFGL